ncbi:MAG TPA: bifunctional 4-hydroxy-2-oxoglutarate aldolase/2-dehydro-3-deoxy-phosphogluconate aldolase [Spirochaetota bacterium]|nr:bifunctional 4-hydroxy-2-oxoglutarate aldolase/2-dehydro-3-deoxy-phosphogluconate aldolase [Spirochaetota bacterium]HPJ33952.1 bifunctional 4-hydroxy-2-oxoglutarate aldolase/2-dehydro-3-deoxy-phosphogluconate aldolase [Spirochaetota bacterium]
MEKYTCYRMGINGELDYILIVKKVIMELRDSFKKVRIIPVSVFEDVTSALKTAELLLRHKVDVIEVTLRSESALDCLYAINKMFPEALTGAGSVLDRESLKKAVDAGARFAVAPCLDEGVAEYAAELNIPFIPGISTPTELSSALKFSSMIKIFPAKALGGPDYLNCITAPFKKINFDLIPTGGIDNENFRDYLECEKVLACGLSYPVAEKLIRGRDFVLIEKRIMELYGEI